MKNNFLSIKNLSVRYNLNKNHTLKNVDFDVKKGEIIGIVGENGSGKSTLINTILGLNLNNVDISYDMYCIEDTLVNIDDFNHDEFYKNRFGIVVQDPSSSLNIYSTIEKNVYCVINSVKKNLSSIEKKEFIKNIFSDVNLSFDEIAKKYPYEISGGMNQRVCIAISLINNPKLLIMDEPTSAIDQQNIDSVIKIVENIKKKYNLSVVIISHDLDFLNKISDNLVYLNNAKLSKKIKNIKNNLDFLKTSELAEYYNNYYLINKTKETKKGKDLLLEFIDVYKNFRGKNVISNMSFKLYENEIIAIQGKSGSGKSTICKLISGIYKPTKGTIYVNENIKVGFVSQNVNSSLNKNMLIYDIFNEVNIINKEKLFEKEYIYINYLKNFNLSYDILDKKAGELSGGQRQIICILRDIINGCKLIILDEPTSSLDLINQKTILEFLMRIKNEYQVSFIVVSHNKFVLSYMTNNIIYI